MAELPVPPGLSAEVLEHLVRSDVVGVHLLDVEEPLLDSEQLRLVELDHVVEFPLLLAELCILLLLLAELGGALEQRLEVLFVGLVLEEVDLGEQLLLLLLQLLDLLLQVGGVHALRPQ